MEASGWFGVRCVFKIDGDQEAVYEERVTVWRAGSAEEAIEQAEADAVQYAGGLEGEYLGLAQVYAMADELADGAEVFSLLRTSSLDPTRYLDNYFSTGAERQTDRRVCTRVRLSSSRQGAPCCLTWHESASGPISADLVLPDLRPSAWSVGFAGGLLGLQCRDNAAARLPPSA